MNLYSAIKQASTPQLVKALNSEKDYLLFEVTKNNVADQVKILCTDTYKELKANSLNFYFENCSITKGYMYMQLRERVEADGFIFTDRQRKILKQYEKKNELN